MIDALVVGGGPAGCAAATLLARWGHTVTLITKPASETAPLGESLPPSTQKLFDLLGVRARVDAAGFVRSTGNTVWWGSDTPRLESFGRGEHGWQVTTTGMEAILRHAAATSGVRLVETRVDLATTALPEATFVLDGTGRSGVFAKARGLRQTGGALLTVALVGVWSAERFEVPDATHTVIASYDGGWAWSVPAPNGTRFVAVMIDPRTSSLPRNRPSREVYLGEIAKAAAFHRMLHRATLVDGPRGWDASMYHAVRYVDDHVLLIGDAGSFIDPLSSAGVKKALASGWLAAVTVHTCLLRPRMKDVALQFFEAREREVYSAFRALTEQYWRDAAAGHAHPFWADRAAHEEAAASDVDVARAFDRVRTAPSLAVRRNPAVRIEARPAVSGSEIVLEDRLVREGRSAGVRYAYDVDLIGLTALAPLHSSVPELFAAYNREHAPVALPDFLAALAVGIAHQWLLWCDT